MVPEYSWPNAPKDAFILGIKELPLSAAPIANSHIYFAHAYKVRFKAAECDDNYNVSFPFTCILG